MSAAASSAPWGPYPPPSAARLEDVTQRLAAVTRRISEAAQPARPPPRLVAVSKLQEPSAVLAAHRGPAAHTHFGENYAQELRDKARVLPRSIQWHYVGQMQTSKAKMLAAIPNLYLVETLDSEKAADALDKALANRSASAPLRVYLQVNTSGEEAKAGLPPLSGEAEEGPLLDLAQHVIQTCPRLLLQGLMTIGSRAASSSDASASNPDFDCLVSSRRALVAALRRAAPKPARDGYEALLQHDAAEDGGLELSMGMSADLESAMRAGSSNVRVGTDCFGARAGSRDEAMEAMRHELEWDVEAKRKELGLGVDE